MPHGTSSLRSLQACATVRECLGPHRHLPSSSLVLSRSRHPAHSTSRKAPSVRLHLPATAEKTLPAPPVAPLHASVPPGSGMAAAPAGDPLLPTDVPES